MRKNIAEVEAAYAAWLGGYRAALRSRFQEMQRTNPDGASAEAAVWWFLTHACGLRLEPGDATAEGGPDFDCFDRGGARLFAVEVTAIAVPRFEKAGEVQRRPDGVSFSSGDVLRLCREAVQGKVRQARRRDCPVLLAVCSTSDVAWLLMRDHLAVGILAGESSIEFARSDTAHAAVRTRFKDSAFFVADDDVGAASVAHAISGTLLVAISGGGMHVIGALNPEAAAPFVVERLPRVPFARAVVDMSVGEIRIEWVVGDPEPVRVAYAIE